MFQIGHEAVCIDIENDDSFYPLPLQKGNVYIVDGVRKCPCGCGSTEISVGITAPTDSDAYCSYTGRVMMDLDEAWFFEAKRFVPIDYTKQKRVTFTEITEDVPVFSN